MAQATSTTFGTVVLGGDLAGGTDANLPQLVASGVIPGTYGPVARWYVNSKGLTVSMGTMTADELASSISTASTIVRGVTRTGYHINNTAGTISVDTASDTVRGVFSLVAPLTSSSGLVSFDYDGLNATTSSKGLIQVGTGLSVTGGVLSSNVPDASTSVKGFLQVGANLAVPGGVLSFPDATTSSKGAVSVSAPLAISGGVVSLPDATTSAKGAVQIGGNLSVTSGVVSANLATASSTGLIKISSDFAMNGDVLSLPYASASKFGIMKVGAHLQESSGVLSVSYSDATTSSKGVVQIGDGLAVTGGVASVNLPDATTSTKGIVKAGAGVSASAGVFSVTHPDATTSSKGIAQAGTGITVSSGSFSLVPPDATAVSKGIVSIASGDPYLSISGGVLSFAFPDATTSSKGIIQISANGGIDVNAGVISSRLATSSLKGIARAGVGLTQTGNQISLVIADATTTTKGLAQFNPAHFSVSGGVVSLNLASGSTTFGLVKPANTSNLTSAAQAGALDTGVNIPKLNANNTFTKAQVSALVSSSYTASFAPDFSSSNSFEMVLTGNVSLTNPTNAVAGGVYTIVLTQDGSGSKTITLSGSAYKTNQTITLSTGANKRDVLTFICKSSTEIFVLFTPGF